MHTVEYKNTENTRMAGLVEMTAGIKTGDQNINVRFADTIICSQKTRRKSSLGNKNS